MQKATDNSLISSPLNIHHMKKTKLLFFVLFVIPSLVLAQGANYLSIFGGNACSGASPIG